MTYKLLALDMDGTLLTSNKRILPRTAHALEQLALAGTPIAFCTGRSVSEMLEYPRELPFVRYGVLASGALVYDFAEQRTLLSQPVTTEALVEAMSLAAPQHAMIHAMGATVSLAREDDIAHMDSFCMGVYQPMFERICTRVDDFVGWVREHPNTILKLNFYHATSEERDLTRARIEEAGLPLTLANAEKTSVECSALGVSKAHGLAELAHTLSIGLDEVVAIGDSENDAEALAAVGMPVAMGNASDAIKGMAKLVVADNNHDGIAEAVLRLF